MPSNVGITSLVYGIEGQYETIQPQVALSICAERELSLTAICEHFLRQLALLIMYLITLIDIL